MTDTARMPLDRESVLRYARLSKERVRGTPDQVVEAELRTWFAQHRFLDKPHFLKLARWKSPRPIRWYEQNDAHTIEAITRAAIASTDERRKMDLLRQLRGVDYRVASTILHFADPDRYMILDVRAKWSLGWDDRPDSAQLWLDYTDRGRALAHSLDIPLRTLDMALWEFSKRNQPPSRDRESLQEELARLRAELEALKKAHGPAAPGNSVMTLPPRSEQLPRPQSDFEQRFHQLMKDLYQETGRRSKAMGKPYWANYFNRSVAVYGGLETARRHLARRDPQDGFQRMIDLGLEDISLEAVVLQHPWRALFTSQELATARRRLENAGLAHLIPQDC